MKIIRIILSLIFLVEGFTKVFSVTFQVNAFTHWGYPIWFMYIIGMLELLGASGLLVRPLRLYANIGLIALMIGAIYTHISRADPFQMMGLAVLASVLLLVHLFLYIKKNRIELPTT